MPKIAEESIRKVAEASDIVEVIGSYIPLKRAGSDFKALCPFHKEKTPSFSVSPSRQVFHCFGCQAGGGVIRFVMDYEQLPFGEAVRKLADRAGVHLIEEAGADPGPSRSERNRLLEIHREAANWYHHLLLKDSRATAARNYLRGRAFDRELAGRWLLGYAPAEGEPLASHGRKLGFSDAELILAGLCGQSEQGGRIYDRFRDRVMIPIHNDFGEVVGFSGRILDPEASPAKYINSPETPIFSKGRLLFGLHKTKRALIEKNSAIVCEGQFDLITAFENGVENVTAPQGTAFTSQQAALLKRFVHTVVLCFDADAAGQKAVERSLPSLLGQGLTVRVLALPAGEDPDSLIRREGGETFRHMADSAPEVVDYLLELSFSSGAASTPRGLSETAAKLATIIRMIPDLVQRDAALNRAASRLRIPPSQVSRLVRSAKSTPAPSDDDREGASAPLPVSTLSEACAFLCRLALISPQAKDWIRDQMNSLPFDPLSGWEVLQKIVTGDFDPSIPASVASYLSTCAPEIQRLVASMDLRHQPKDALEAARSTWRGILRQELQGRSETIKAKLGQSNLPVAEAIAIQKELLDLHGKLQELARPDSSDS